MYANKVTIFAFVNFFLVIQAHTIFTTLFTAGKKPLVEHDEATIGTPPPKVLQRSATLWNNIHSWDDTNSKNTVERAEDFVTVPPPTEILQRSFRCNRRLSKRVQASFACRPYDARMKRDKAAAAYVVPFTRRFGLVLLTDALWRSVMMRIPMTAVR